MFNTKNKGFGFGRMPGFNQRRKGSISNGDFDRDGVKNRGDCDAFNFRKQEGGEIFKEIELKNGDTYSGEVIKENSNIIKIRTSNNETVILNKRLIK